TAAENPYLRRTGIVLLVVLGATWLSAFFWAAFALPGSPHSGLKADQLPVFAQREEYVVTNHGHHHVISRASFIRRGVIQAAGIALLSVLAGAGALFGKDKEKSG